MRSEYDLKTLQVKRRGILPSLKGQSPEPAQLKITMTLDDDLVNDFKAQAQQPFNGNKTLSNINSSHESEQNKCRHC